MELSRIIREKIENYAATSNVESPNEELDLVIERRWIRRGQRECFRVSRPMY